MVLVVPNVIIFVEGYHGMLILYTLLNASVYGIKMMTSICDRYAAEQSIRFNMKKS